MSIQLNANALISLAQAKDYLDIGSGDTSQDDRVTTLINAFSDFVQNYCSRVFISQQYTHNFNGDGTPQLLLWQFPVTAVASVNIDRTWGFQSSTLLNAIEYGIHRDVTLQRRYPGVWTSNQPRAIQVVYTAGYTAIPFELQEATLLTLAWLFDTRDQRKIGIASRTKLGEATAFGDKLPEPILALVAPHVRATYVAQKLSEV